MKEQIREVLEDSNWIDKLEGLTQAAALLYIKSVPKYAIFDADYYGYEGGKYGELYYMREETDEEYAARLAKEDQAYREKEARKLLAQETQAAKMERYAFEEVALHAYLKQHEGNPQINDLENLFMALQGLEREGAAGTSVRTLKECMAGIEKNS